MMAEGGTIRKTQDKFSMDKLTRNITPSISVANPSNSFGLHPQQIKDNDYVSESLKEKIVNGKDVNMVLFLMKSFEKVHDATIDGCQTPCDCLYYKLTYEPVAEVS